MSSKWTTADIPDQSGRVAIITGANTGLGLRDRRRAGRQGRARRARRAQPRQGQGRPSRQIKANSPNAVVELQQLDLTSLDSRPQRRRRAARRAPADRPADQQRRRDVHRQAGTTKDGFELQFGTNHLGHFALTGLLLDHLLPVDGFAGGDGQQRRPPDPWPRSTSTTCSGSASYNRVAAYGQSKLANLMFTYELQRRLEAQGRADHRARRASRRLQHRADALHPRHLHARRRRGWPLVSQSPDDGCAAHPARRHRPGRAGRPVLRARRLPASSRGHPVVGAVQPQSHDEDLQRRLWAVSEELTGVTYPV